ncbi:hypothetical protein [Aromatoleum anaerobium]|uniref:Uncharacterized protein n=1 Tax=Aromatoleum anaerobium TaxID=182180 RepID=A0ABX1PNW6_9RHOO
MALRPQKPSKQRRNEERRNKPYPAPMPCGLHLAYNPPSPAAVEYMRQVDDIARKAGMKRLRNPGRR